MEKSMDLKNITLGVCYYPEQWPESLWENDVRRMKEYGIQYIRVADFAWNKFEPFEGVYIYEFFDRFLSLAHCYDMRVILCTPTASPPAWLTEKYIEVLNAKEDGTLYRHGMRRHYNYNSPIYRKLTANLVHDIAEHYCPNPAVAGWQIDNELNGEPDTFYSQADHAAFKAYLKNKFKTLDKLNEALGTVFWNQTYTSWDEIHLSRPTGQGSTNPHLALEEKRFISQSTISFCRLQAEIIKKFLVPGQFITTNGLFRHLDSHEMTEENLDFITYDSYPNFPFDISNEAGQICDLNDRASSWALSRVRSISPNFGIMEQQTGALGWTCKMRQPEPKPGQMKLWTFQSIAHGADFVSFFRWRTSIIGTEIYCRGLLNYDNLPNRRLSELADIYHDVQKIREIAGSKYQAKIAYAKDYANEWDAEQDIWHGSLDSTSETGWFTAAQMTHTPMDMLFLRPGKISLNELVKYEAIIYPHPAILTKETADLLETYVAQGGKLIFGARTGYKDEYGRCLMKPTPGFVMKLCGLRVDDATNLGCTDDREYVLWDGEKVEAPVLNEILQPIDNAIPLAVFQGNYYDGSTALVKNDNGKGSTYYFGAAFQASAAEVFLKMLNLAEPYSNIIELSRGCELAVRSKEGIDTYFILNYQPTAQEIQIKVPMLNVLQDKPAEKNIVLERYGVMILSRQSL
jgi:beta-galactosidase